MIRHTLKQRLYDLASPLAAAVCRYDRTAGFKLRRRRQYVDVVFFVSYHAGIVYERIYQH